MTARRVAVTGLGIVSPVGLGKAAFWEAVAAGRSGVAEIRSFDASGQRSRRGAEVKDFSPRQARAYLREAASQALEDGGLSSAAFAAARGAVFVGTTFGECLELNRLMDEVLSGRADERTLAQKASGLLPGSLSADLARALKSRGPQATLTTACAAGNGALAAAWDVVGGGTAQVALAGGVDLFSPAICAGFNRLFAVAPERCAPFSAGRQGLIPGEGCALLLVEDWERALCRGARIYAEILGYGLSCDAHHATAPDAAGVAASISDALRRCALPAEAVDYISAHGTGTVANDKAETAAIKSVFGARARGIPISSIKAVLGHAMGAASAFEAAACCLAIESGKIPPTAHFEPGDPDCDLDYVPRPRALKVSVALSNAFAFGGGNCVLALASPGARPAPGPRSVERVVVTAAAEIRTDDPVALARRLIPAKDLGLLDAPIAYALCGAAEALRQSGLSPARQAVGIVLESSGELETQFRFYRDLVVDGPRAVEPAQFPNNLANAAASRAGIVLGLKLADISLAGAYPGGEGAVAFAWRLLRQGLPGALLVGGVDGAASVFALETEAAARRRGAAVLAEIESVEESFDPQAAAGKSSGDCFCLARAVRKVSESAAPVLYISRSRWGGNLKLKLSRPLS